MDFEVAVSVSLLLSFLRRACLKGQAGMVALLPSVGEHSLARDWTR